MARAPSYENFMGDVGPNLGHAQNWFNWAMQQPQYNQYLTPQDWSSLQSSLSSAVGQDPYYGGLGSSYASKYIPDLVTNTVPGVGLSQALENYIGQKVANPNQMPNLNMGAYTSPQARGEGFRQPGFWENLMGGGGWGGLGGSLLSLGLAPFTGGASLGFMPAMAGLGGAIQGGVSGDNWTDYLTGGLTGLGIGGATAGLAGALGLVGAGGAGTTGALTLGGEPGLGGLWSGLGGYTSAIPGMGAGGMLSGLNPFSGSLPAFKDLNYSLLSSAPSVTPAIPGGDVMSGMNYTYDLANRGGGGMGNDFWNLGDILKNKKLTDFIPSLFSLGSLMGSKPAMPNIPNVPWPMANQGDVQSALANYQNLQQPLQDWQTLQWKKQMNPIFANFGALDSTYYADTLSNYLQGQNALTNAQIPGILGQQYQTQAGMAGLGYQAQIQNYLEKLKQQYALQNALGQGIGNIFSPSKGLNITLNPGYEGLFNLMR